MAASEPPVEQAALSLQQFEGDSGAGSAVVVPTSSRAAADERSLWVNREHIELRAEELSIHKQKVNLGEVTIRNEVITEMQRIEVPVRREELVVERHGVEGGPPTEILRIRLNEERVLVEKQLVVLEEVAISRREVTEVQRITVSLRREELHIETEGDIAQTNLPEG